MHYPSGSKIKVVTEFQEESGDSRAVITLFSQGFQKILENPAASHDVKEIVIETLESIAELDRVV